MGPTLSGPEQARGKVDARTDISAGVMLYEMLRPPAIRGATPNDYRLDFARRAAPAAPQVLERRWRFDLMSTGAA